MAVTVSGMFSSGATYFAGSPVVIDISGLSWPEASPFTVVRVEVLYNNKVAGKFHKDTGGQTEAHFDISSALRAIWSDYDFAGELAAARSKGSFTRGFRSYALHITTEYLASDDGGVFTATDGGTFTACSCAVGAYTEMERSLIGNQSLASIAYLEGNAGTKPAEWPERVGSDSITSRVQFTGAGTQSTFYAANATGGPAVLRDSVPYTDFLFVNRRGAVETCSGQTLESMGITVKSKKYGRVEGPKFIPSRTTMAVAGGGRRSWQMSSGYQTSEWAEWWAMEFLTARQWWMLYGGAYVPVTIEPSKENVSIYDRTKQQMPHVDFTVTLALEG